MNLELLVITALAAGFFGSGHCLGMCGPVVVLLESPTGATRNAQTLLRRLSYNVGRLSFYVLLGVVAGASGALLTKMAGANVALFVLRVLASLIVLAIGLNLLFNVRTLAFVEKGGAKIWKRLSPLAKKVLPVTSLSQSLAAGFIWGALPCGLVYGVVAAAATSGSPLAGAAIMLAFWIGTLPALLLAGASARKLATWSGKKSFRRFAGAMLVIVSMIALLLPLAHKIGSSAEPRHQHTMTMSETL